MEAYIQCRAYHCGLGGGFDLGGAVSEISPEKPTVLFPLAAMVSISWFFQERSSVMVTPKYLLESAATSS